MNIHDHKYIGKKLKLFHFQKEAKGMPFWHYNGTLILNIIKKYIRTKLQKQNYQEVHTPFLLEKILWQKSKHWDKYIKYMFISQNKSNTFIIKPMSCPCHIQIFNTEIRSYKELPFKISEFGICHRNEASGGLNGLLRTRSFTQDDGHIFCSENQLVNEINIFCKSVISIYKDFGFNNIKINISNKPKEYIGDQILWEKAEHILYNIVKNLNIQYHINQAKGAFYGPKIEFILNDILNNEWQCGTLQLDFFLPYNLKSFYIDKNGKKQTPILIHRAILGTFERFIGLLLEHTSGKLPIWLSPIQIGIISIIHQANHYVNHLKIQLNQNNIRTCINISNEQLSTKIKKFYNKNIPILIFIGLKEQTTNKLTVHFCYEKKQQILTLTQLISLLKKEHKKYLE